VKLKLKKSFESNRNILGKEDPNYYRSTEVDLIQGELNLKIEYETYINDKYLEMGAFIKDKRDSYIGLFHSGTEGFKINGKGKYKANVNIKSLKLFPGEYTLGLWAIHKRNVDDACENALIIDVVSDIITENFVDYDRFKGYGYFISSSWNN
jgi:hypothetical protein